MFRNFLAILAVLVCTAAVSTVALAQPGSVQQLTHNVQIDDAVTLTFADLGAFTVVVNTGDTDANIYTLPDCEGPGTQTTPPFEPTSSTIGGRARFALVTAFDVTINPADTTDKITGPGTIAGAGGDAISSSTAVGEWADCVCTTDDNWSCSAGGTWTDVN